MWLVVLLIVVLIGYITITFVGLSYLLEMQKIDRFEIEYWKKKAEAARQFNVEVSRKIRNGIRRVRISRVA